MTTQRNPRIARKPLAAATSAVLEHQFYSPDGTNIRVTHEDGSVAVVGAKPRPLPKKLWRAATRAGCLTAGGPSAEDLRGPEPAEHEADAFNREAQIRQAMLDAIDAEENAAGFEDAFTGAGIPNVRWLEKRLGFGIDAAERDAVWGDVKRELDDEDGASEAEDETQAEDA